MSRTAIIGSCITRDVWRACDVPMDDVLYVARSSLASLTSTPIHGPIVPVDPPSDTPGFGQNSLRRVVDDLAKTSLDAVVAHAPTHLIFDFIEERFPLLVQDGAVATQSWELDLLGLVGGPGLPDPQILPRPSPAADALWIAALPRLVDWLDQPAFANTKIILHHAQWADAYVDAQGADHPFFDDQAIWEGLRTSKAGQNAQLRKYRDLFLQAAPRARFIKAPSTLQVGDAAHVWGLSPFHYIPAYYDDIWRRLRDLGV